MSRILGSVPNQLADLLDIDGGRVLVDELRDSEGVGLVYDIGALLEAELLAISPRTFDTGALNQSTNDVQTMVALPRFARIVGINVSTDAPSRIDNVQIYATNMGGPTGVQDHKLWAWGSASGRTIPQPAGALYGAAILATTLIPEIFNQDYRNFLWINQASSTTRFGYQAIAIETLTTAFGAGTVRVTGNIVFMLPFALGNRNPQQPIPLG